MLLVQTKEKGLAAQAALDGVMMLLSRIVYPAHMDKSPHQSKVYISTFFVKHIYIFQKHIYLVYLLHIKSECAE